MTQRSPELVEAISATIVQQPFFAVLLLDLLEVVETESIQTCATNGRQLLINPKFFKTLDVPERVYAIAHEILHVILQHPQRAKLYGDMGFGQDLLPFSFRRWNHAGDYIINAWLNELKVGKQPVGTLLNGQFTSADLVDDVYMKIPEPPPEEENFDSHLPADPNAPPASPAAIQRATAQAASAAKQAGRGSAGLQRLVDQIIEPQVHWQDHLRANISTIMGQDTTTWQRPNRRRLAVPPHVYWPGKAGVEAGPVAIEIDTSGSISDRELSVFLGETAAVLNDVHPEVVYVGFVDSALHNDKIHELHDANEVAALKGEAGGGGGTNMLVMFEEMEKRALEYDMMIVLTDGYCEFGEDKGIPTIWCITTEVVAPWGTTIHVKIPKPADEV